MILLIIVVLNFKIYIVLVYFNFSSYFIPENRFNFGVNSC